MSTQNVIQKYLKTAKAIYLDKNRVKSLAHEIQAVIAQRTGGLKGPLGKRVLVEGAPHDILAVNGETLTVYIRVQTVDTNSPYYVVSGGMGHSKGGHPVVIVNLNANLLAENYYKSAKGCTLIRDQIYPVLLHELTHAADIFAKGIAHSMSENEAQNNRDYYNAPGEVRAYLQEIISEVEEGAMIKNLEKLEKLFGSKVPMMILNYSNTWQEVSPHLTERNKQLVMKAVARLILETRAKST